MDVVIVGAGAAGLWAAGTAASLGARVLLVEKTRRAGSKVLASGGTRCNLTTTLDAEAAAARFGAGERFVQPAFRALPPHAVRAAFADLGVPTVEEPELQKVFPASHRAIDVRDALVRRAAGAGATLRFGTPVSGVEPSGGRWAIHLPEGPILAPRLLLCPGGRSYPATGTTGDGYAWLDSLGLDVVPPVPALVPLTSDARWVHALSGVSLPEAEARLVDGAGRVVARRRRPVLFTHRGLSGPGAMDLSEPVARAALRGEARALSILLDLLPDVTDAALDARLVEASRAPGAPSLARIVGDRVPARLLPQVVAQAGLADANPRLHVLPRADRLRLVGALKGLRVPLTGTLGWDEAEVTGGGLALDAVRRTTMAVRGHPGLYVFGELLDLTGPIGGLNFQAAFATGELAARDAVRASPSA